MATPAGNPNSHLPAHIDDAAAAEEEKFCKRYAVLCTAHIPSATLNGFLATVRQECPPSGGAVLRVITATSGPGSIAGTPRSDGGTRPPVSEFESPFIGQTVSRLRDDFLQALQADYQGWAVSCFAVLDERFLKDGTVLLISIDEDEKDEADDEEEEEGSAQTLNHRCDARITLDLLLDFEMNGVGVDAHDDNSEDFDHVFTYRSYQERTGAVFPAGE